MSGVATAVVAGAVISSEAGKRASDKQVAGQRAGTAEGQRQFDLQWDANAPFREGGVNAFNQMRDMTTEGYEFSPQDPSYGFRFGEGERATQNYLSGSGLRLGGSAMKALTDYGQGSASQEYGNQFNRLSTMAGYAPAANTTPSNQIAQGMANVGQAQAGKYSAYNNAIQGGIQNYLAYDTQNKFTNQLNQGYGGGSPQGVPQAQNRLNSMYGG